MDAARDEEAAAARDEDARSSAAASSFVCSLVKAFNSAFFLAFTANKTFPCVLSVFSSFRCFVVNLLLTTLDYPFYEHAELFYPAHRNLLRHRSNPGFPSGNRPGD